MDAGWNDFKEAIVGDKGGKKDKEKNSKQQTKRHDAETKERLAKVKSQASTK